MTLIKLSSNARPHPSPLPRGEGEPPASFRKLRRHNCGRRVSRLRSETGRTTAILRIFKNGWIILPLLGERAGVRAVILPTS